MTETPQQAWRVIWSKADHGYEIQRANPDCDEGWESLSTHELLRVISDLQAQLTAKEAEMAAARASSRCPICGEDTPHGHIAETIARWVDAQASRFGMRALAYWPTDELLVEAEKEIEFLDWDSRTRDANPMEVVIERVRRFAQELAATSQAKLTAAEERAKTAEAKAALADEIRPLVELLAGRIAKLKFAGEGETWEVFEAWAKVARDGNVDGPCWLARYDALQPAPADKDNTHD